MRVWRVLVPLLLLLLVSASLPVDAEISSKTRSKEKALWNLEEMTECVLHYSALAYNNYGCWCGVGGAHEPVDGIDADHDHCYDEAIAKKECYDVPVEYLDDYSWTCEGKGTNASVAVCEKDQSACRAAICACDEEVTACWKRFPKPASKKKCNASRLRPKTEHFEH